MKTLRPVVILSWIAFLQILMPPAWAGDPAQEPPPVQSRLKLKQFKSLVEDKEVVAQAKLEDLSGKDLKKYHFLAAMLVGASVPQTRKILTDYRLYAKMIPYVEKAEFDSKSHILQLEGGIWRFKLQSWVRFEERSERWIQFKIVGGHFIGLGGDIVFDAMGERGTVIHLSGEQDGKHWPPKFVIERGAEIVFGFTAKRMRSYIESQKKAEVPASGGSDPASPNGNKGEPQHDSQLPQPRSRL